MIDKLIASRFVRFIIVGGGATLLQYALLMIFVELQLMGEILGSASSFGLSALCNYWFNYHFTFVSDKSHQETLPKFAVTAGVGLTVNTMSFSLLLVLVPHYMIAQLAATAVTLTSNFLLHKHWIYRSHHDYNNSIPGDSRPLLQRRRGVRQDAE